ncbi:MAG: tyrosine-type recombinase/integrase [Betaproteobacteria bacterium]|nr:tyrosine-type recombinase/integrase [Betaproteobacteria bacterium]
MALTDTTVRNAKAKDKPYKLADERGMFLLVSPNGSKWWRLKYRLLGKEKLFSLGVYPDIGLKDARKRRDDARALIANGIDPAVNRQVQKAATLERAENSLEVVAREWFAKHSPKWAKSHSSKIIVRLEKDVFPYIGARPIAEVEAPELLKVLQRIESRGAIETAHRAHQTCGQIFRYAIATGRAKRDIAADLRGALQPVISKHHASITEPKAIGALLRAIEGYDGSPFTKCALRLAPLVFLRPGELRHAEWTEIDLDQAQWRIPGEKMKMGVLHIVPLSTQAVAALRDIQPLTGHNRYVFPSVRTSDRPMSENTVNAALRRLGYTNDQMTGHGFRSMASTLLNENGWNRDAIERQLAHGERNEVRAAYNYAEFLPERGDMMQWWADYLQSLATGAKVIPLRRVKSKAA